jgi:S-formylglutathione hydrolase FrmB
LTVLAVLTLTVALPTRAAAPALVEKGRTALSPRLLEVTFGSTDLGGDTTVRILLPAGYASSSRRYPVVYLLNGGGGSYLDWTTQGDAEALTATTQAVVVMPDGGQGGNYTDWYGTDGRGVSPRWETYHLQRLLPWVDAHFRTLADRSQRAVVGLSMGGNGALHYAARHPDLFVAAASFSGANDVFHPVIYPITETTEMLNGAAPGAVFGPRATEEVRWRGSNPVDLAGNLRSTWVSLSFGNGQPGGPDGAQTPDLVEQAVHDTNVTLHEALRAQGIAHRYDAYGPGSHTWFYWQRELRRTLPLVMAVFAERRRPPGTVTYSSIDSAYAVWGWQVRLARPVLEVSRLIDASRRGFTLRGTGRGTVTTAPFATPHRPVRVTVEDVAGRRTLVLRAGTDRRLTVPVDLGPASPTQQYSPASQLTGTAVREARVTFS